MDIKSLTKKQRIVFEAFQRENRPMTVQQAWLAAGVECLGQATLYRAVAKLEELGFLSPVEIHGEPPMWETKSSDHHHHFYCTKCNGVFELQGCPGNFQSILPDGFSMSNHSITIYGNCSSCQN